MESDLAQIKLLLWIVLAVQVLFVAGNIACRWFGCGKRRQPDYADLLAREKYEEVLSRTETRLNDYPADADALYFRACAFERMGDEEIGARLRSAFDPGGTADGVCAQGLGRFVGKFERAFDGARLSRLALLKSEKRDPGVRRDDEAGRSRE